MGEKHSKPRSGGGGGGERPRGMAGNEVMMERVECGEWLCGVKEGRGGGLRLVGGSMRCVELGREELQ